MQSIMCRPFNAGNQFAIHTMEDFPSSLPDSDLLPQGKALIVIDPSLPKSLTLSVRGLFDDLGYQSQTIPLEFKSGKSLEALLPLWTAMTNYSPQLTVGVGGGTTCDLVGFAAASYKRGSCYMLFPTTTLAMVDACVSGKTGIDFQGVKNIIGAIHYPLSVINVLPFLDSIS